MEHPVHFVPACSAATVDGLGLCAALGFGNHDTEVIAAPRAGSGEVYSHAIKLTLPASPFKSALGPSPGGGSVKGRLSACALPVINPRP
jgi:hypothetical protein